MGDFRKLSGAAYNPPQRVEHEEQSTHSAADAIRRMNEQGGKTDAQARAESDAPYPQAAGVRAPDVPSDIQSPPEPNESGAYLMRDTPTTPPYPHKQ